MYNAIFTVSKLLVLFTVFSFVVCEELAPPKPVPFHNLIPRFKMPRGNLLRYKIPQWEVLYFLKYGIVPFIFYDPNFNRTNFITQVHKFKMYFDDGTPINGTQIDLKDDESFREFLRKHGYPNYNQLPENALSRNNKMAEEINGLLRAASNIEASWNERRGIFVSDGDEEKDPLLEIETVNQTGLTPLDILLENLERDVATPSVPFDENQELVTASKRMNSIDPDKQPNLQQFWHAFINKYPFTNYFAKAVVGGSNSGFLVDHDPGWSRGRSPYSSHTSGSDIRHNMKTFRIGLRNVDTGGGDDPGRSTGTDARKGGKNFQTQGW